MSRLKLQPLNGGLMALAKLKGGRDSTPQMLDEASQEPGRLLKRPAAYVAGLVATATACLACGTSMAAPAAKHELCPERFGSFSTDAGRWPPACWRPYGPDSPFNTPIPPNPRIASDSAATVAYMRSSNWSIQGDGDRFVLSADGSRPVYWSNPSDPFVRVRCTGAYSCKPGMRLRIPRGALPEAASDGHMTVVDQIHELEYDFSQATAPAHGEMVVSAGNSIRIGPAKGTGLGSDSSASYLGALGGLIRAPELAAGQVHHALAVVVPCVSYRDVWPSPSTGRGDKLCARDGFGPHLGNLLQLKMSSEEIAATRAPRWERAIMRAMAHYGAYVVDTAGASNNSVLKFVTEDDRTFTSVGDSGRMRRFIRSRGGRSDVITSVPIPVARLRVIDSCVPRRTC